MQETNANHPKEGEKHHPILLEEQATNAQTSKGSQQWPSSWIEGLHVTQLDYNILRSDEAWLSDVLINAAQILLKRCYPLVSGLQNVNCGQHYSFDVQNEEFVQILHTGETNYWHVISTIGTAYSVVNIFDSMFSDSSVHSKAQNASLIMTKERAIQLNYIDVQRQCGKADCGLFAIAFATTLCHGLNPGAYIFEQSLMRSHLLQSLQTGCMPMFPIRKYRRSANKLKKVEEIQVICTCRMPIMPKTQFIQCKEWYHPETCIKVNEAYLANKKLKWLCSLCN